MQGWGYIAGFLAAWFVLSCFAGRRLGRLFRRLRDPLEDVLDERPDGDVPHLPVGAFPFTPTNLPRSVGLGIQQDRPGDFYAPFHSTLNSWERQDDHGA